MVSSRFVGAIMMVAAVLLFLTGYFYAHSVEQALLAGHTTGPNGECIHPAGANCPFEELAKLQTPKFIALIVDVVMLLFGFILIIKPARLENVAKPKAPRDLSAQEKKVFAIASEANGMVMQSELVEKTGLSKVAVTRILDKLEMRSLIERRRRGMTNLVVLRHS